RVDGIRIRSEVPMFTRSMDHRYEDLHVSPPWILVAVLGLALGVPCRGSAAEGGDTEAADTLTIRVDHSQDRQVVDGFGGSLVFWGFEPDEESLRYAFEDLGA